MPLNDFPRYPLMFGPSPVHRLDRLSEHLGGAAIWAKREDCNSGLAYGGNKLRKLEYLVPDALAQGADTLVSIGGVQSNHTRQVAAVAARLGLKAVLVQESWVDWPDPLNDRVGNILLSRIMGADVRLVEAEFGIGVKSSWEQALDDVRAAGGTPYPIPAGASDHWLGGLGFANWAQEVQQQESGLGIFFDTIVVCSVTGFDSGGDDRGVRRAGSPAPGDRHRCVGEAGRDPGPGGEDRARHRGADRPAPRPGRGRDQRAARLGRGLLRHPGAVHARRDPAHRPVEGMIIDPVYEGKSMAGLIDLVRTGQIGPGSTVLYAHLGGQPALNAYSALFR